MKSISLDFKNNTMCIMADGQQGTMYSDVDKKDFLKYIPDKYSEHHSFTWNFENETFAVNQDYTLPAGAIMTKDCFIPQVIIPMKGLKKHFFEFLKLMDCEIIENFGNEVEEMLRKMFGLE